MFGRLLDKPFKGALEHIANFMVAEERAASCCRYGLQASQRKLVDAGDLLEKREAIRQWKARALQISRQLFRRPQELREIMV